MLSTIEQLQQQLQQLQPMQPVSETSKLWEAVNAIQEKLESVMKLKHMVVSEDTDIEALLDPVIVACLNTYSTKEEQATAILHAREGFKEHLDAYFYKAFKMGKKIGKMKADEKDTIMYGNPGTEAHPCT